MDALIFREIPRVIGHDKDQAPEKVPITGAAVAQADIVRAILLYGTYDRYYFLWDSPDSIGEARDRLALYPNHQRAEIITVDDLVKLKRRDRMILFTGSSLIHELAHLRGAQGRLNWPAAGITHALSYLQGIPHALMMLLGALYKYDCLICTSQAGRRALQNIFNQLSDDLAKRLKLPVSFQGQLPVIPLGTDATTFRPRDKADCRSRLNIPADHTVFLYVGRFSTSDKADLFPLILNLSQTLARTKDKVLLVLAGNDSYGLTSRLESFAGSLGAGDKIKVISNITSEDKGILYSAADVFVSLSDSVQETFGLTVIEAMASGLPVIASDWSGYRESVEHEKTGFLVPTYWGPADVGHLSRSSVVRGNDATHWWLGQSVFADLKALENYMTILCENSALRQEMGAAGRQQILSYYHWPNIVRQYEELWRKSLRDASARKERGDCDFRHGISSYDYLSIFRHYGTDIIPPHALLRVTALGDRFAAREIRIEPLEATMSPFCQELSYTIVAECRAKQEMEMRVLLQMVQNEFAIPEDRILQNITRLIKYGILEWIQ